MVTTQQHTAGVLPNGRPSGDEPYVPRSHAARLTVRRLTFAYGTSLLVAALLTLASLVGLTWGAGDVHGGLSTVLVSRGANAANFLLVPLLLVTMWAARRESLLGLLLWPGALFYALYAYLPYFISASAS